MLKVSYLYPEVHNCCENWTLPAPLTLPLRPRRFYCALAVSATILAILTKISNRRGIAVL